MLLTKHINEGAAGLGVQNKWSIGPTRSPVRRHAHGGTDLSTKDHVMVLPCNCGSILLPCAWSLSASADVKVGLFHLPYEGHIALPTPSRGPHSVLHPKCRADPI